MSRRQLSTGAVRLAGLYTVGFGWEAKTAEDLEKDRDAEKAKGKKIENTGSTPKQKIQTTGENEESKPTHQQASSQSRNPPPH